MAPKKHEMNESMKKSTKSCGVKSPGPIYGLMTVVGYKNHCQTKPRNPAYSIGLKHPMKHISRSPGPIYMLPSPKLTPISIGIRRPTDRRMITPGPYSIHYPTCSKNPGFTIKFRTKPRSVMETPGPNYIPKADFGPAFTIAHKSEPKSIMKPGPYNVKIDLVKPRVPAFTCAGKSEIKPKSQTPAPYYLPVYKSKPLSFGIKHHECSLPFITKNDDKC